MDKYYLKTFGVDVSHYQVKIDWTKMHTIYNLYPINFAFIRSHNGTSSIDETFEDNWEGAKENNILRGAYHFLSSRRKIRLYKHRILLQK